MEEDRAMPENDIEPRTPIISQGTLIPISAMVAVVGSVIGGMIWIGGMVSTFETRFEDKIDRLGTRLQALEYGVNDRWRGIDMELFAAKLKTLNPNLNIPDVSQILKSHR